MEHQTNHTHTEFCGNCGKKIEGEGLFCRQCGAPIAQQIDAEPISAHPEMPYASMTDVVYQNESVQPEKTHAKVLPIVLTAMGVILIAVAIYSGEDACKKHLCKQVRFWRYNTVHFGLIAHYYQYSKIDNNAYEC